MIDKEVWHEREYANGRF